MAAELSVSGWLTIPAGEQAELLPLLAEHTRLTHAEPGCLAFAVTRNPDDPERFELAESFRDRAAFEAHRSRTAASPWGMATRHIVRTFEIAEAAGGMTSRCAWAGSDPLMQAYHDSEWGVPERDPRALWEKLVLDGFQAGLAWITILRKRETMRAAFAGFDPAAVARFGEADIARLLADPGIIRSRAKIDAAVAGARLYCDMADRGEDFAGYAWSFTGGQPLRGDGLTLPAKTGLSDTISKDLKRRGFKFVGPTIVYAWMQAVGIVNDHAANCFRRDAV